MTLPLALRARLSPGNGASALSPLAGRGAREPSDAKAVARREARPLRRHRHPRPGLPGRADAFAGREIPGPRPRGHRRRHGGERGRRHRPARGRGRRSTARSAMTRSATRSSRGWSGEGVDCSAVRRLARPALAPLRHLRRRGRRAHARLLRRPGAARLRPTGCPSGFPPASTPFSATRAGRQARRTSSASPARPACPRSSTATGRRSEVPDLLRLATHVAFSAQATKDLTGLGRSRRCSEAARLRARTAWLAATNGAEGAFIAEGWRASRTSRPSRSRSSTRSAPATPGTGRSPWRSPRDGPSARRSTFAVGRRRAQMHALRGPRRRAAAGGGRRLPGRAAASRPDACDNDRVGEALALRHAAEVMTSRAWRHATRSASGGGAGASSSTGFQPARDAARLSAARRGQRRHEGGLRRGRLRRLHGGARARARAGGSSTSRSTPASCCSARRTAPRWSRSRISPSGGALHPVQAAMVEHHGSQCGFCTPGIVDEPVRALPGGRRGR